MSVGKDGIVAQSVDRVPHDRKSAEALVNSSAKPIAKQVTEDRNAYYTTYVYKIGEVLYGVEVTEYHNMYPDYVSNFGSMKKVVKEAYEYEG